MRTALALTDGYLSFRDTILTRAQREWVIGGRPQTDEEIKTGVVEMVGAYLNAARWGDAELQRRFGQRDPEQSLTDWLPAWRDEDLSDSESEAVAAFGFNSKGSALFPFNRNAIEALALRHLTLGGKLVFNPRRVINEILRNTLLMRPAFEANAFPPQGYEGLAPNANLANWIRTTHQPDAVARRLAPLLTAWGGDPIDTTAIAHIPPPVFTAFHLPTPADLANVQFVPNPVGRTPHAVVVDRAEQASMLAPLKSQSSTRSRRKIQRSQICARNSTPGRKARCLGRMKLGTSAMRFLKCSRTRSICPNSGFETAIFAPPGSTFPTRAATPSQRRC